MKLLYIEDGMTINYNRCETNMETIFGLDEQNNIIQGFTFQTDITIVDKTKFDEIVNNSNKQNLENGFLFYSFRYQIYFAHYMTQTVPKLYEYINNYSNYKLLIPNNSYNKLCKDILQNLNINIENITVLQDKTMYIINDYITSNLYNSLPSDFTSNHLWIFHKIREPLNIIKNNQPYKKIYIKRDGFINSDFGNSETGIKRQIINENELIERLIKMDFKIVHLGDKLLSEKKNILENSKLVITALGANCLNIIFSNAPKNMIILSNNENFGYDYYINLCQALSNEKINSVLFKYESLYNNDNLNQWNSSFYVNIDKLCDYIKSID
jgi:capsular polysaccharide biosynthesis protein